MTRRVDDETLACEWTRFHHRNIAVIALEGRHELQVAEICNERRELNTHWIDTFRGDRSVDFRVSSCCLSTSAHLTWTFGDVHANTPAQR